MLSAIWKWKEKVKRTKNDITFLIMYIQVAGLIHSLAWMPQLKKNKGLPDPDLICKITLIINK